MATVDADDSPSRAPLLRRGEWLGAGHDRLYGRQYKWRAFNGWRASSRLVHAANRWATRSKDIYQFGVYTGGSMRGIAANIHNFGRLWGFDSFTGLPSEKPGLHVQGRHWRVGSFSAADSMAEHRLDVLLENISRSVQRGNVTLVPGYFADTLKPALLRRYPFQQALLVDVDVDLHISSMQALEWMLHNRLLRVGSLVRYDDWVDIDAGRHLWGEPLTHRTLTAKYNLTWRTLGGLAGAREFKLLGCGVRVC